MKDLFENIIFLLFISLAFFCGFILSFFNKYNYDTTAKRICLSIIDGITSAFITMLISIILIKYFNIDMEISIVIGGFIGHLGYKTFLYIIVIICKKCGLTNSELLLKLTDNNDNINNTNNIKENKNETNTNTKN